MSGGSLAHRSVATGALALRRVSIPREEYAKLRAHCLRHRPEEACGLLRGVVNGGRHARLDRTTPMANRAEGDRARTYQIDPTELRIAEDSVVDPPVLGVYHSHPEGSGRPSNEDVARAWPGYLYLIVPLRGVPPPTARAFTIDPDLSRVRELQLIVEGIRGR